MKFSIAFLALAGAALAAPALQVERTDAVVSTEDLADFADALAAFEGEIAQAEAELVDRSSNSDAQKTLTTAPLDAESAAEDDFDAFLEDLASSGRGHRKEDHRRPHYVEFGDEEKEPEEDEPKEPKEPKEKEPKHKGPKGEKPPRRRPGPPPPGRRPGPPPPGGRRPPPPPPGRGPPGPPHHGEHPLPPPPHHGEHPPPPPPGPPRPFSRQGDDRGPRRMHHGGAEEEREHREFEHEHRPHRHHEQEENDEERSEHPHPHHRHNHHEEDDEEFEGRHSRFDAEEVNGDDNNEDEEKRPHPPHRHHGKHGRHGKFHHGPKHGKHSSVGHAFHMFAFSTSMLFASLIHTPAFFAFWSLLKLTLTAFVLVQLVKKVKTRRQVGAVRLEEEAEHINSNTAALNVAEKA